MAPECSGAARFGAAGNRYASAVRTHRGWVSRVKKLAETVMSRISGKVLAAVVIPAVLAVVALASLKIYLVSMYPGNVLKEYVTAFVRDNFRKAVTFDDAYMSVFGNIVISNLNVSIGGDFNDNISLIKCGSAKIRLGFLSVLAGRPVIRGMLFEDPEITLYKKYGKGYLETFRDIFSLTRPVADISLIDHDRFVISIDNSRLLYREVFRDETLQLKMERVSARFVLRGDILGYDISGRTLPLRDEDLGRGRLRFSGKVKIAGDNSFVSSASTLGLGNIDVSYFNLYIAENAKDALFLGGGLDASVEINTVQSDASFRGRAEVTNLEVLEVRNNERVHFVSHENLNIDLLCDSADGFGRLAVRRFELSDDNVRLSLSGIYNSSAKEKYFDVTFDTNAIDLARMSENITPVRGAVFRGVLKAGGRVHYDLQNGASRGARLSLDLDDFGMKLLEKKGTRDVVKQLKAEISLADDVLKARVRAGLEESRFDLAWETFIKKWAPLSTESFITLDSPEMAGGDILGAFRAVVEYFYEGAYEDKKIGYDVNKFHEESLGQFLNANNVKARLDAKKVVLGHRAILANVSFDTGLRDGRFYLENFIAAGYGAEYSLKAEGQFNLWQPMVSVSAGIKNFDLKSFGADAGVKGEISGVLGATLDFQVGAYRLSQILDNAIMDAAVEIAGGSLKNTPLQDRFAEFLEENGVKDPDVKEIALPAASFNFSQRADNFQVTKLYLQGDRARFYARGRYWYDEGLNVPVEVTVAQAGAPGAFQNVPLEIKGPLAAPKLYRAKGRNDKTQGPAEALPLFNIN